MHDRFQSPSRMRPIAALAAALAVAALAACDRPSSPDNARQQSDSAMTRPQQPQKPAQPSEGGKSAAGEMAQGTERMAGEVSNKVKDAAITTAVNAKIAGDSRLSVLRINVDTVNGRVMLRGTAPDAASSERAQQLASSVDGVLGVDNQLVVGGKG
jgi:hyperosmotically inducible periplasmic protein